MLYEPLRQRTRRPVVTILGYPSKPTAMGGLRWLKRVTDYIEQKDIFYIKKIHNERTIAKKITKNKFILWTLFSLIDDTHAALKALFTNPDIAILDTYGEANIILWILLRFFKPNAKILSIFHHYEPTPTIPMKNNNGMLLRRFQLYYNHLIERAFKNMIKDSDRIITVSNSSMHQLYSICGLTEAEISKKVVIAGAGIDQFVLHHSNNNNNNDKEDTEKDIDFLCIGRIDKFEGIEKIWQLIKHKHSKANFVMIGQATDEQIHKFSKLGIDHMGILCEDEKLEIYSRAKVFLFPSMREGFGMAVAESLCVGLPVVAWKIPVFEELYCKTKDVNNTNSNSSFEGVILIEPKNYKLFADESLMILNSLSNKLTMPPCKRKISLKIIKTWNEIGDRVITVLKDMVNNSNGCC